MMHLLEQRPEHRATFLELEAAENHRQSLLEQEFYNLGVRRGLSDGELAHDGTGQSPIEKIRRLLSTVEAHLNVLDREEGRS